MKSIYQYKNIIGADETGVGDYLTPLICAAVYVSYRNVPLLEKMGIKDSKKFTNKEIIVLYKKIKDYIKISVKVMEQESYNELNKKYNANELKMYLHMQAISSIENSNKDTDLTILDAFSNDSSINKYKQKMIQNEGFADFTFPIKYIIKGESEHVSVAAASIVARAYLLDYMNKQNKKWDVIFPLGTNKTVEEFAIKFIEKNGLESLNQVAKLSFKTTDKIKKEMYND